MSSPNQKSRRAAQAAKVAARSAQSSGRIKCYVEKFVNPRGEPDLRLREKATQRIVRVLATHVIPKQMSPLSNLLQDSYAHGGGLVEARSREEYITVIAPIHKQNAHEIAVLLDDISVKVTILTAGVASPPTSVWCYIEEYPGDDGSLGLRLRQKVTGRKVEMFGKTRDHLATFLASPRFTGAAALWPNLYERNGFDDYVLVSGGTTVDSYDVLLFEGGDELAYLLGPGPDTAYRDAFRVLEEESPVVAHARTAEKHLRTGLYREAVLAARLAVEMATGGGSTATKRQLEAAPEHISTAGAALYTARNAAVHGGGTRFEQPEALEAIRAMRLILGHFGSESTGLKLP